MPDPILIGRIREYAAALPAFSDHDHHSPDAWFQEPVTLDRILGSSYVAWTGWPLDGSAAARADLLDNLRFNSYFHWLERGIGLVHGIDEPIAVAGWEVLSDRIAAAYAADPDFHWQALGRAGIERLVLDSYLSPGDDDGHPEAFSAAYRIDKLMYGTHADDVAPNDYRVWERVGFGGGSLDDYVDLMRVTIRAGHANGRVVALKCAEAYNRPLDLLPDDEQAAARAFGRRQAELSERDRLLFGNVIFNRACELAAELEIPFQVHTGLAALGGSNPLRLEGVIARHPRTRFVLFHSGYPWIDEAAGLAHNHANVLPSLTWTPLIATSAAIRALDEFLDVGHSVNHITWGTDSWVAEEAAGGLLAWRQVIAVTLATRIEQGRMRAADAEPLVQKLLFENGRRLYGGARGSQ